MGAEIKSLDSNHLVSNGLLGGGQCGMQAGDYQTVSASPGVDVASVHDYGGDSQPISGDQWNGIQVRINQMAAIGKPLMVGETGIMASAAGSGCDNFQTRSNQFQAKINALFAQGVVGFMPWDWVPSVDGNCSYDIGPGDPTLALMAAHAFVLAAPATPVPTPTPTPTPTKTTAASSSGSTSTTTKSTSTSTKTSTKTGTSTSTSIPASSFGTSTVTDDPNQAASPRSATAPAQGAQPSVTPKPLVNLPSSLPLSTHNLLAFGFGLTTLDAIGLYAFFRVLGFGPKIRPNNVTRL